MMAPLLRSKQFYRNRLLEKSGRPMGKLDKMTDALKEDIQLFLNDRTIKQIDLMKKHNLSRNTLKKYITLVKCASLSPDIGFNVVTQDICLLYSERIKVFEQDLFLNEVI